MPVAVGRGLDGLVAQVPLDYRQRDTGLDKRGGSGMPQVMGAGPLRQALSVALVKAGTRALVWKFCARTGSMGAPRQPLPE
jgi:hypothetical protein